MQAAIYARRSVAEDDKAADAKSVQRQSDLAREYAARKGWQVADERVYVDDGIGGAEHERRPALMRLLAAAEAGEFDVLIVSEQKSIAREMVLVGRLIEQLAEAGVTVWAYGKDECLTPRDVTEKLLMMVRAHGDENERVKASERMHEAHQQLARKGHVTGGRVFGYRNRKVFNGVDRDGNPLFSHVEREVDPDESLVVRRAFDLRAQGLGLKAIARRLNSEGAISPRYAAPKDGPPPVGGWTASTLKALFAREIYRGIVVWNQRRKCNARTGQIERVRSRAARPEAEWVRVERTDLRIVGDDVWNLVQRLRAEVAASAVRFRDGRLSGRPPKGGEVNLLAGLAVCGACGGGLNVESSGGRRRDAFSALPRPGERVAAPGYYRYYVCRRHRHYGTCANALRVDVGTLHEAVLQAIEEHVLVPEGVEALHLACERDDLAQQREALERELADARRRVERLGAAIELGGDAPSLLARLKDQEARAEQLRQRLAGLRPLPRLAPRVVEDRLAEWRRALRGNVTQARAVLQRVLQGRITFTPRADGQGYDFACPTRYDRLFAGVAVERPAYVPRGRGGLENLGVEDTAEGDYGRLLERAQRALNADKSWRPWRDSNPRSSP